MLPDSAFSLCRTPLPRKLPGQRSLIERQGFVVPSTEKSGSPNAGSMYQLVTLAGW